MAFALVTSAPTQFMESKAAETLSLLESSKNMEELKQIHAHIFKTGFVEDPIPMSKVLSFCASRNSGNLAYAQMVFDRISNPNTFMWNAMIRGYANSNKPERALFLYQQMLSDCVPHNGYTFPFLLKACSSRFALEETKQIHAQVIKLGYGSDVYAANSLLHVYTKCSEITSAQVVFDQLSEPDMVTWNSMIDGYAKLGELETASRFFNSMPARNIISWTTMISGYIGAGMHKEALNLFHEMQIEGIKPDKVVLASTLSACSHLGALDQGRWIHGYIYRAGIEIDPFLGCALIDMFAKCGNMEEALEVFGKLENKGVGEWTAVLSGFAIHGHGRDAIEWFLQMQKAGIEPNSVTFTAVLSACSHAGLVHEGRALFKSMESVHNLKPAIEHYGCMVDLLGRAGLLNEAKELIKEMPTKPNDVVWGALLNACRIHKNVELGKQIGRILVEEEPNHSGRFIQLASFHAAAGEWDLAVKARKQMKKRKISKLPGCSMINITGTTYEFFAGGCSQLEMDEIYQKLDQIIERLKEEGYRPEIGDLLLDLEDEEKESAIYKHSEKLAIAFGLIKTNPGSTIQIFKNLRVCEDCHTLTKLISKIYNRTIIMRDRTRFHHFRDGKCTCGDYW